MAKEGTASYFKWLGNLLLVVASLAVLFMVTEVVLMVLVPSPIVWLYPQELYVHHPTLLHKLKPNQRSFTHSFPVATNVYGLRDRDFTIRPRSGTFRILCLGDSLTFGDGVEVTDTYPKQLESLLNAEGRQKYEVINAGVDGYDTWHETTYLKEDGWRFEPRLVIIGVYGNDIVPKPIPFPQNITELESVDNHGLINPILSKTVYFLKRSRVLLLLRDRSVKLINRINPSPEYRHELAILNGTVDPFVERGWNEVDDSLGEMVRLGKEKGFDLLLVVFPFPDQIVGNYPHARYQSRLKDLARKHEIDFIDLMPSFARNVNGFGSLFIEWDGHPNPRGHHIAAREVARHLLAKRVGS